MNNSDDPNESDSELVPRIGESIRRQYSPTEVPAAHLQLIEEKLNQSAESAQIQQQISPSRPWRRRAVAALAIAATAATIAFFYWPQLGLEPSFQQQPLEEIYADAIRRGFTPYYDCGEDARFRSTFLHRHGVALQLATLPDDIQMLGVSYPGGITRQTTAILFVVEKRPVMVFVDIASSQPPPSAAADATPPLSDPVHVYRTEKSGLAFYEVTPLDQARATPLLLSPSP